MPMTTYIKQKKELEETIPTSKYPSYNEMMTFGLEVEKLEEVVSSGRLRTTGSWP